MDNEITTMDNEITTMDNEITTLDNKTNNHNHNVELFYEILEKIFLYNNLDFLIRIAPYVCKKWRDAVYYTLEYRNTKKILTTSGFNSPRWQIFEILYDFDIGTKNNLNILDELLFAKYSESNIRLFRNYKIIEQLFSDRFKTLKKIRVTYPIHEFDLKSLKLCTNITEIIFKDCNFTDISPLLYLKKLKSLYISYCNIIENINIIENLYSVEELILHGITNINILPNISKLTKLWKLIISNCINLNDIKYLKKLNIKDLELCVCPLIKNINVIPTCKKIESLSIALCHNIETLDCLSQCKNLKYLNIKHCDNLKSFKFLNKLKSLYQLNISNNSKNLQSLTLNDFPYLEKIELYDCNKLNILNFYNLNKLNYLDISNTTVYYLKFINGTLNIVNLIINKTKIKNLDINILKKCKKLKKIQMFSKLILKRLPIIIEQYNMLKTFNKNIKIELPYYKK